MENIKGYYEGGTFIDGNPQELKSGMVLKGRHRDIQEFMWSKYPKRLAVAECLSGDIGRRFIYSVINSLAALEEALDEPCSTPIDYSHGFSRAEVVNVDGKWRWDVIQWKHDGRWRNSMVVSFPTDRDWALAMLRLKGWEGFSEVSQQASIARHSDDFDNTFEYRYKWKTAGKPTPDSAPLFSCQHWSP
jgi:hypothetical protein